MTMKFESSRPVVDRKRDLIDLIDRRGRIDRRDRIDKINRIDNKIACEKETKV
jgi:hypothetical protein